MPTSIVKEVKQGHDIFPIIVPQVPMKLPKLNIIELPCEQAVSSRQKTVVFVAHEDLFNSQMSHRLITSIIFKIRLTKSSFRNNTTAGRESTCSYNISPIFYEHRSYGNREETANSQCDEVTFLLLRKDPIIFSRRRRLSEECGYLIDL
ncbi:hypothetical protein EWB00_009463 [Schistosoma japonicum]|uniref:Uncharacterized protein n=1 Tax=Schistosoma japonicum TaxID=6182 RepID=A0A4Z2DS76_SCHJA|nr:hypothetical protein EWB00_009463 [Schistosoma japonicum]